jgi:hypothetical protein
VLSGKHSDHYSDELASPFCLPSLYDGQLSSLVSVPKVQFRKKMILTNGSHIETHDMENPQK